MTDRVKGFIVTLVHDGLSDTCARARRFSSIEERWL
jgi:hypothetical protein